MLAVYGLVLRLSLFGDEQIRNFRNPDYKLAWYVVPLLVLLALGATVWLGAMAYCMARGKHLSTTVNLGGGKILVGCG